MNRRPTRPLPQLARRVAVPLTLTLVGGSLVGTVAASPVAASPVMASPITASPITAGSPVVVSEVYGGGGNSGATYTHDFVELYNLSTAPVDLSTWRVQYFSATGTTPASTTSLVGTLAPSTHYLVQMAAGSGGTSPLPPPDATGSAALSGTSGRVVLLDATAIRDGMAYGPAATPVEGSPTPATTNTTSASRVSPCSDTDDNAVDFTVGPPSPRGSSSGSSPCVPVPPDGDPETVAEIQGAAHLSPLTGRRVNGVTGVVTARGPQGFWLQSTTPDADPATSEGLYVYTRTPPSPEPGDVVSVDGMVSEFRPGGASGNGNLTTTEVIGPTVRVLDHGQPLPAPVLLGHDRLAPAQTVEQGNPGNVENPQAPFRPDVDAIDFYESMEGMRVAIRDAQVVGPTASFGEIPVVPGKLQARHSVRSARGGVIYSGYDHPNAMRIQLDDALLAPGTMPAATVGDTIPGDTPGVLDYSFANFKLAVDTAPVLRPGHLRRERTTAARRGEVAVATFNVENLAPSDNPTKFARLATQVVQYLASPDVLALEEIQDDSGAADDGTISAGVTVARLTAAISAAGGPTYAARWVDPQDKTDGGQPGGNIRQVLLFRTDRGLSFIDRPGGDAQTATTVLRGPSGAQLSSNPGRIDPTNPAFMNSRKPLVTQFQYRGKALFVIANHFSSKGGDDPLFGRWQQPVRSSETARHAQAAVVRGFVDQLLAAEPGARVVVVGDLNDFEFSRTTDLLVGNGVTALTDLPRTLPASQRYTYIYQGNSQVLDHILLSRSLVRCGLSGRSPFRYDIVHTNSEFPDQDSDHDPQVVRLRLGGH